VLGCYWFIKRGGVERGDWFLSTISGSVGKLGMERLHVGIGRAREGESG